MNRQCWLRWLALIVCVLGSSVMTGQMSVAGAVPRGAAHVYEGEDPTAAAIAATAGDDGADLRGHDLRTPPDEGTFGYDTPAHLARPVARSDGNRLAPNTARAPIRVNLGGEGEVARAIKMACCPAFRGVPLRLAG